MKMFGFGDVLCCARRNGVHIHIKESRFYAAFLDRLPQCAVSGRFIGVD